MLTGSRHSSTSEDLAMKRQLGERAYKVQDVLAIAEQGCGRGRARMACDLANVCGSAAL